MKEKIVFEKESLLGLIDYSYNRIRKVEKEVIKDDNNIDSAGNLDFVCGEIYELFDKILEKSDASIREYKFDDFSVENRHENYYYFIKGEEFSSEEIIKEIKSTFFGISLSQDDTETTHSGQFEDCAKLYHAMVHVGDYKAANDFMSFSLMNLKMKSLLSVMEKPNDAEKTASVIEREAKENSEETNMKIQGYEQDYENELRNNFSEHFSDYTLIETQKETQDGGFIDIFAICKTTGRPVIIELKLGNESGRRQLRDYAFEFTNPILINISENEVRRKSKDIEYLTFESIGMKRYYR